MSFKEKILFLIVVAGIYFTNAEPFRNDLRITGGTCVTPDAEKCYGINTKGEPSPRLYRKLGRTVSEARSNDWMKWKWSKSCDNDGLYNGYQWFNPREPLSVVLLFDAQETIAGMQFWIPRSEVTFPTPFQYENQPVMRNATVAGAQYYYMTVYFMDPSLICTGGRSVQDLTRDGTITELYIQEGPSPRYVKRVSLSRQNALREGWGNFNCQSTLGWHSFYNQQIQDGVDECTTFHPLFMLFDNNGNLNGLGFIVAGKLSAPSLERLTSVMTKSIKKGTAPKCISDAHDRYELSSLHVFFSQNPYDFRCPGENSLPLPLPTISDPSTNNLPVCIVGAGMSGFGVATELEKKGYRVEIFEKTSRLGGKVYTYRKGDDIQVEMCPLLISPVSHKLAKYIDDFHLTRDYFDEKDRRGYAYESMEPKEIPPSPDVLEIAREARKYIQLLQKYKPGLQYGYLNSSSDLSVSIYDWLKANKFGMPMIKVISLLITTQGYGALEDIPAMYVLQLLDEYKMQSLIKPQAAAFFTIKEGLDYLVEKIVSTLKSKIHLNHEVTYISRQKDRQVIHFNNGFEPKICSKVILAFPPLLSNVQKIMALSEEERDILAEVKIHKYTSAAHHIPSWNVTMYVEAFAQLGPNNQLRMARPMGSGEPVVFLRQDHGKMDSIYSSYSWIRGSFDSISSEKDLELINRKLNSALMRVDSNSKTFFQENPEYFPHVTPAALQNGFYRKFDGIQGSRGVYFATTLLTFEIMEKALEMGEILVKKYF